jgi:hypothetical protein
MIGEFPVTAFIGSLPVAGQPPLRVRQLVYLFCFGQYFVVCTRKMWRSFPFYSDEFQEIVMNRVPDSELILVPGGTLITATPEAGRALALTIARHTIHNLQPDLDILKAGRPNYSANPDSLIAASQVVAIEFQTIATANNYWRK